jgi:tRNA-Thr(GGU) m(6)t(6)A37 methyltransferase TsaA
MSIRPFLLKGMFMAKWIMQPIGFIRSSYTDPKQVPKGLGAKHTMEGVLEVLPEMEPGLQDLEGFSHLIIVWVFDRSEGYDLVVKPPSDVRAHGIFATRAPRRPNPIGITVVELIRREGGKLWLRGIDMVDGTPVLDIKPLTSSIPMEQLRRGWLQEAEERA